MMRRLALLGAGGHGKVVADSALCAGWQEVVFYDDAWPGVQSCGPWPVAGNSEQLLLDMAGFDGVVVTIGSNAVRLDKQRWLQQVGAALVSVVHPAACVSRYATIGLGSVVMAGAVLNIDVKLGQACIINTGATVDHDDQLADGVHLSPGAHLGGGATVGECSWIGLGASVREGVSIGRNVRIGAGAAVVASAADDVTLVGVPARPLGPNEDA
jgi:sugar O-acyltransferase (sialic acid O-acetyltransferase NeuD family)